MPRAAMTQNGRTSLTRCDRPPLPQAHLRFNQYEGTVATALPKTVLGTSDHRWSAP